MYLHVSIIQFQQKTQFRFLAFPAVTRVGGNKKGIFTRNREPKSCAHHLRRRYYALAKLLDDYNNVPEDLDLYVTDNSSSVRNEL
jgi:beta-glucuronidase